MIENILNFFRNSANIFDYFSNISEFLCMIISICLYKTYKKKNYYIYFLLYTIAVVIVETLGSLKSYYEIHKITYEYDVFGLVEYILIGLIYYNLTNSLKNKKIITNKKNNIMKIETICLIENENFNDNNNKEDKNNLIIWISNK